MNIIKRIWAFLGPWLVVAIVVAIIVMGIGAIKSCNKVPDKGNPNADYFKKPGFKTDTIRIHDTVRVPVYYTQYLPPKTIYKYDSGKYVKPVHDTVWKDTGKTLSAQTSNYNRIIYGEVNKDTIRLDIFSPSNSSIQSTIYPVDFTRYRYQMINNELRVTDVIKPPTHSTPFFTYNGTYVVETHNFFQKSDNIGLRSGINIGKARLSGFFNIPVQTPNPINWNAGVAVGLRLF